VNTTDLALLVPARRRRCRDLDAWVHEARLGRQGRFPAGVAGWFDGQLGFKPGIFWAWVAILAEALGGVLVVLGLGGPLPAAAVVADLVVVTIVAHVPKGFWSTNGGWEFPVPIAAGPSRSRSSATGRTRSIELWA
jgi:putative oxidoreductase